MAITSSQTGIKSHTFADITKYNLFLGGTNTTANAIKQYDPLKTGYGRIFFVKMPVFLETLDVDKTRKFQHILEYGFTDIEGLGNTSLEFEAISGGYAARQFEIATIAKDETQSITIKTFEFSGSPIREYISLWINGISDQLTGIGHYHGAEVKYSHSNHIAEAIYAQTDPTGKSTGIEYACLLTSMIPKQVKVDHFNHASGTHALVPIDIEFTCVKYESAQINKIAANLIAKCQIVSKYMDFKSDYDETDTAINFYKGATGNI